MDFQQGPYENNNDRYSPAMATASVILGVVSLAASGCIYPGLICGSLGIIFAFLSRGGTRSLSSQATWGLCLCTVGLMITILILITSIFFLFQVYGGFDGFLREYMDILGIENMEELYRTF